MKGSLRVLLVEDSEQDYELLLLELGTSGYDVTTARVETAEAMGAALDAGSADIVLTDWSMPAFSALAAGANDFLSICHRIVSELGGEIAVHSAVGVGSTFRVFLPMTSAPTVPAVAAPPPPPITTRRGRVLVVDDDADVGRAVARTLSDLHDVDAVTRARDALIRITAGERFDVVLCDLMMPEMTGMELHRALLEISPDQVERMIFLTGGTFTEEAATFLEHVDNARFEKPFRVQELLDLVSRRVRSP